MLTFKEFLYEVWQKNTVGARSKDTVRGANVTVWAIEDGDEEPYQGHYNVGFEVNGREHSDEIEMHGTAGHQVLHHVARQLHSFVKEHKPKSIKFDANEKKKHKAYTAFASTLARHLGGKHEYDEAFPKHHTIHFDHGKKS